MAGVSAQYSPQTFFHMSPGLYDWLSVVGCGCVIDVPIYIQSVVHFCGMGQPL